MLFLLSYFSTTMCSHALHFIKSRWWIWSWLEVYGSWVERYEVCYRKVHRKLLCKSIPQLSIYCTVWLNCSFWFVVAGEILRLILSPGSSLHYTWYILIYTQYLLIYTRYLLIYTRYIYNIRYNSLWLLHIIARRGSVIVMITQVDMLI